MRPAKADFGDADFPIGFFSNSPKSYHDAWCKNIKNECRVRFQKSAMWVEGQGGIHTSQFISYRLHTEVSTVGIFQSPTYKFLNYISYKSKNGQLREALFIFANSEAQTNFVKAFLRWRKQTNSPVPNYELPSNQGPQETHGKDEGLNPYENPPIEDWRIKTTD